LVIVERTRGGPCMVTFLILLLFAIIFLVAGGALLYFRK
jgi:hypothetical protein